MLGRVVPLEALDQPAGLGRGKGLVQRSLGVGVQIVLDEDDLPGGGKVRVGQVPENMGIVDGGVAVGDLCRQPSGGANSMNRLAVPLRPYS